MVDNKSGAEIFTIAGKGYFKDAYCTYLVVLFNGTLAKLVCKLACVDINTSRITGITGQFYTSATATLVHV